MKKMMPPNKAIIDAQDEWTGNLEVAAVLLLFAFVVLYAPPFLASLFVILIFAYVIFYGPGIGPGM